MINKFFEFFFRLFSGFVYATLDDPYGPSNPTNNCLCGGDNPPQLCCLVLPGGPLEKIMGFVFPAGGLIAVAMIIVGGYMWITSGGDPGRIQQAQATLTWSIIGLVLLVSIYMLLKFVLGFVLP